MNGSGKMYGVDDKRAPGMIVLSEWKWRARQKHADRYRWLLTFDEINVSVGDDSCEQKWMNNG